MHFLHSSSTDVWQNLSWPLQNHLLSKMFFSDFRETSIPHLCIKTWSCYLFFGFIFIKIVLFDIQEVLVIGIYWLRLWKLISRNLSWCTNWNLVTGYLKIDLTPLTYRMKFDILLFKLLNSDNKNVWLTEISPSKADFF
jgi:hypothetical protein